MKRSWIPLLCLALSSPAWAGDMNVSGRYLDIGGDPIVISQAGKSLSISPDMKGMPDQAKQFLGEVKLTGTIETKPEKNFAMAAKYENTIEPMPGMKLKMNVKFDATGQQSEQGLVMKSCEWDVHMVVFAKGEIAGSENMQEKCVGLWKKN